MSNKKNDDLILEMPLGDVGKMENGHLLTPREASPVLRGAPTVVNGTLNSPVAAILAYCSASISMTVVNKFVVSGNNWNLHFIYLAIQCTVCVLAVMACKQTGLITNMAPFDSNIAKRWIPVSVLFVGMIYTGNKSLQYLSVPVYTIFKNLSIITTAYGEVLMFGGRVSSMALLAFGLMVLSSVVAAWADIRSATENTSHKGSAALSTLNTGYSWMALNIFCTSSYVLGNGRFIKNLSVSNWDTMFYNNLLTIPILAAGSLLFEDWSAENLKRNFPADSRDALLMGMIYSGLTAIFISYCTAWCIRATSSTTYSMVGALNKLPIAVCGLIFFAAPVTFGSVSAIFIGFISGIVYTWAKLERPPPSPGKA